MDDTLRFRPVAKVRKASAVTINKKAWLLRNPSLSGSAKAQIWHSLFLSKWNYALLTVASVSKPARVLLTDLYYLALKKLLNIRTNIQKEKTLMLAVGAPWRCYLSHRAQLE